MSIEEREINVKMAKFMGWDECFDNTGCFTNTEKFNSIVGEIYNTDGYNPIKNPEQYIKIIDKLISLGYNIKIENLGDYWMVRIKSKSIEKPFIQINNKLGLAICSCTCELIEREVQCHF
jgi:hypothetical protein